MTVVRVVLLAAVSLLAFVLEGSTAFEWPTLHDAPLLARALDPEFLRNDFITNSGSEPSPRMVFVHILVGLAWVTGNIQDWYAVIFLCKVIIVVLLPGLLFLVLWQLAGIQLSDKGSHEVAGWAIFAFLAYIILRPWLVRELSIAWFPALSFFATPNNFALLFLLSGTLLMKRCRPCGIASWFASTTLHPATGPFGMLFIEAAQFPKSEWRDMTMRVCVGGVVPAVLLAVVFVSPQPLDAAEFVHHYARVRHPSHFVPSQFGTLTGTPWYQTFATVLGLLLVAAAVARVLAMRQLQTVALLFAATYGAAILVQWLIIDIFPIKLLVAAGPVRYSSFGLWMLVVVYAALLGELIYRWRPMWAQQVSRLGAVRGPTPIAFAILGVAIIIAHFVLRDDPFTKTRNGAPAFYGWLKSTPVDAVFAVPGSLSTHLPLVARRAVVIGNGFPFREDFFREHSARQAALYGSVDVLASMKETALGVKEATYYRSLAPQDFVRIQQRFRLDYVIVEESAAFGFVGIPHEFRGDGYIAFAIEQLRTLSLLAPSAPKPSQLVSLSHSIPVSY